MNLTEEQNRRKFGEHFTSIDLFNRYIFPRIQKVLDKYIFIDLFCGSGNLILPILDHLPEKEKIPFFQNNIFLFDVQDDCIQKSINNAIERGIPADIAQKNIIQQDTLRNYPNFLSHTTKEIYHITNPPYLYLGYIAKHPETQKYLPLFTGENDGYQDLYQIALMNDLRHNLNKMIYIIPSNFIFGNSVSNKIRLEFFPHYRIDFAFIFEKKMFEFTGTNVMINFFSRKSQPDIEPIQFNGYKFKKTEEKSLEKQYKLLKQYKYKAGSEFEEFINEYRIPNPLTLSYYLKMEDVEKNKGSIELKVIDSNAYENSKYKKQKIAINPSLAKKIKNNILWIRTVDTGSWDGRAGLFEIQKSFGVDGILVTKNTYRTNPIQLFFDSEISITDQRLLKEFFNFVLEYLRAEFDSEFMTTYKYSTGPYTRKYFGLSQCKNLIKTFPIKQMSASQKKQLHTIIKRKDIKPLLDFLKKLKHR